jgi:hypothetical protein
VKTIIAVALAALALTACASSYEKETEQQNDFSHSERALETAQTNAVVNCHDQAQCDDAWQQTKAYISQHSDEAVIRADARAIESDVPGSGGHATYSATREAKGNGATITLYAQCKGMYGPDRAMGSDYDKCVKKIVSTQNGFALYLQQHVTAN